MSNDTCIVTFFYPGIEKNISRFIKTLENQSYKKFDVIIYFNNKKKFIIPKNNLTIFSSTMNKSIILSRFEMIKDLLKKDYKYIIFQDADDLMKKNRVDICYKLLKKFKIVINDLDIYGNKIFKNYLSKRISNSDIITSNNIKNYNFVGMSNSSLQMECLRKIVFPKYKNIKMFDWYFWTILLSKYKGIFTDLTSTKYFTNNNSTTCLTNKYNKKKKNKINTIKTAHFQIVDDLIKKKIIKDSYPHQKLDKYNKSKYKFWWE